MQKTYHPTVALVRIVSNSNIDKPAVITCRNHFNKRSSEQQDLGNLLQSHSSQASFVLVQIPDISHAFPLHDFFPQTLPSPPKYLSQIPLYLAENAKF